MNSVIECEMDGLLVVFAHVTTVTAIRQVGQKWVFEILSVGPSRVKVECVSEAAATSARNMFWAGITDFWKDMQPEKPPKIVLSGPKTM